MPTDEMLVLACSTKWGGRCVAGISKRTGGWLRPVSRGPALLGNRGKAVPEKRAMKGVEASLALVRPEWVEFSLERPHPGKSRPRPRVNFELDGQDYDLALTDYLVAPRLTAAGLGAHGLADLGLPAESDMLLTVSLAEPKEEWCTKLVAAVILLPRKS